MIEIRNIALKDKETLTVYGHTLKPKYDKCQNGFLEMSSNHINTGIILVNDSIVDENTISFTHIIGNYNTTDKEKIIEIENNINDLAKNPKANDYLLPSASTKLLKRPQSDYQQW